MLFMNNKVIHSVNPLTDKVIFIEVRPGPFKKMIAFYIKNNHLIPNIIFINKFLLSL